VGDIMGKYVIGIDIGGTHFRVGMVDENKQLYNFVRESSSIFYNGANPVEILIEYLKTFIENNAKKDELLSISIGFPSTISKDRRVVYSTPNLNVFSNVDVVTPLEEAFNVPIFINKDVNYLLQYEIVQRNVADLGIIIGIFIGTGYGNSVYINGQFLIGKNGVATELGHIPVAHVTDICGCGNEGCIETIASGRKLEEIRKKYFPETSISEIFLRHREDPILLDFVDMLTIPVATEINIFDPDLVIIGGGVVNMEGFPREYFESCIYKHTRKPYPAQNLNISYSLEDKKAGVMGAAYYAFERLKG